MWGKALNGDFYKGVVTGLGEMLHIKFDNGDTIAHDRTDTECVVFDQVPEISDLEVGKKTQVTPTIMKQYDSELTDRLSNSLWVKL